METLNKKATQKPEQYYSEAYGLNAPENYERYFVPVIGRPLAEDLVRLASIHPGERVLDVACGTGIVTRLVSRKTGKTGAVTALDINPGMLAVARSLPIHDASVEWIEAPAESMPLPDDAFDVVLCQLSLQFMEDKSSALKEMQRTLKSGGRIFLNVPGSAGEPFKIFARELEQHISAEAAGFVSHVFSLNDIDELRRLMNRADFRDIDIEETDKILHLPPPKEFLWQYVHSTPLMRIVAEAGDEACTSLETEITKRWQKFETSDGMAYHQRMITVSACK